ncbi:protein amnionless isoform X2 [Daphnia magna]|uniref:protein amnionless isoform X2 n=1 Tax=Daphnia magna TaxID=35525 RepID=UPI001E1BA227|nr:protein amnionless isoform X2 [Daphnia magna]
MTMVIRRSVIYYVAALLVSSRISVLTDAYIKEWHPVDTDWQNKNNWEGGQLPCWRSRVVLPEEVVISIFLNGIVAWNELVMPQTGELVLDELTLNADTQEHCNSQEIKFKNWKPSSWFDPDRWQISESDGMVIPQPLAIPHSERIPCAQDSVHLLKGHSLSVDFNRINSLTVGQVKYGDQLLTVEEWRNQLNGKEWKYQVHNPPHLAHVNGTECQDVLGCRCGHDVDVIQMVCSNAGTLCSNQLECPDSFRPPGHCCDMCGAMMKVTVNERTFTKSAFDRLVSSMLVEDGWPASQSYSYRTEENILHVMIVDNTTNERSINVASKIYDYLNKDKESSNLYGIVALEMIKSGLSHSAVHHYTPEELHLIASNLSTVFATFVLLGGVLAGIYFYKRRRFTDSREELSVGFARFQNDSGNVEIAIDASFEQALARPPLDASCNRQEPTSPFTEAPEIPNTSSDSCHGSNVKAPAAWKKFTRAFTNPLFGDPSAAASRLSARWTMSSLMKTTATQENPIYNMDVPDSSATTSDITNPPTVTVDDPVDAIVTLPAATVAGRADEAEGEGVAESNAPPLVDTFPAVSDDEVSLPAEGVSVMEDVSLVDETSATAESAQSPPLNTISINNSANGSKHPLKRLWKKATQKLSLTASGDPTGALSSPQSSDAEPTAERFTAPQLMGQQCEDEMQLTLAEETDE